MSKTGGYIRKKDGIALCVHCGDQVRGWFEVSEDALHPDLKCNKCDRTLKDALVQGPPPETEELDIESTDDGDVDVFTDAAPPKKGSRRKAKNGRPRDK